jgi:hypothetical protein
MAHVELGVVHDVLKTGGPAVSQSADKQARMNHTNRTARSPDGQIAGRRERTVNLSG